MRTPSVFLFFLLFCITSISYGQTIHVLYGLTYEGGTGKNGTLYSYDLTTGQKHLLLNFNGTNGSRPTGRLCKATDGTLYGTTFLGGSAGTGVLFHYDPVSGKDTILVNFTGPNGNYPEGELILAKDGMIYGMANGGSKDDGVFYRFNPTTFQDTVLINFNGLNGNYPGNSSIIQAVDGKLYARTLQGGTYDGGVLFCYDPKTVKQTIVANINKDNPLISVGENIVQTKDGTLCWAARSNGFQWYYFYNPITGAKDSAYTSNGVDSYGNILISSLDSEIYSIGKSGNTCLLNFYQGGDVSTAINYFTDTLKGILPNGTLIEGSNYLFYGVTNKGGTNNDGVLYSWNPATLAVTVLINFDTIMGTNPMEGVIEVGSFPQPPAEHGMLYGTSRVGGSHNYGVLFNFDLATDQQRVLVDFDSINGSWPSEYIMQASNGLIYGLTSSGGKFNAGVLYSFNPSTEKLSVISDFTNKADDQSPLRGCFVEGADGWLYCAAAKWTIIDYNPNYQYGLFKLNPVNNDTAYLFSTASSYGRNTGQISLQDPNGLFYGISSEHLVPFSLYSCDPSDGTITDIHSFGNNTNVLGLYKGDNGLYYISTFGPPVNGNSSTTIYSFNPVNNMLTAIPNFNPDGQIGMCFVTDSLIYGYGSISYSENGMFSLNIYTQEVKLLTNYSPAIDAYQWGNTILGSNKMIYGYGAQGDYDIGTIYEFNTFIGLPKTLFSFNGANGKYIEGELIELHSSLSTKELTFSADESKVKLYPSINNGEFSIVFQNAFCHTIRIYNELGEEVYYEMLNGNREINRLSIDLNNQPSGIYIVQFIGDESIKPQKIIIQK